MADPRHNTRTAVIIAGPTAVGKSEAALAVCERYGGELVSADSMQVYRGLNIGTAKPTDAERARIPHHMIDIADPHEPFSVAEYRARAEVVIDDMFARKALPVICGGSGLYINSLLYDMDFSGTAGDADLREKYTRLAHDFGNSYIYDILQRRDPAGAEKLHANDRKKVIRALERIEKGGERAGLRDFERSFTAGSLIDPLLIVLTRDRADLYELIEQRTDRMIDAGLEQEVRGLTCGGMPEDGISLLGIGYKEMLAYIRGDCDLPEAIRLIKQNSRRYAKRQMTWFRRWENALFFEIAGKTPVQNVLPELFAVIDAEFPVK
ncbi:MAG: tRNA (adenosine(37)-N6)-dimethylallyltransferase MiaA [Clostridiales Family XIII bacterium]|jgi:tRNA dimethylallyltransferase|nr:tRNA (adenosine(37)-N6)-dimethylallyltransferase MiaA [Clostridiales Family XIII bacterium]